MYLLLGSIIDSLFQGPQQNIFRSFSKKFFMDDAPRIQPGISIQSQIPPIKYFYSKMDFIKWSSIGIKWCIDRPSKKMHTTRYFLHGLYEKNEQKKSCHGPDRVYIEFCRGRQEQPGDRGAGTAYEPILARPQDNDTSRISCF
jgi:hypothetical protein